MHFRNATPADLDELVEMMRQLYQHDGVPFDEPRQRVRSLELIAASEWAQLLLIEVNDVTAGYCVLTYGFSLEYHGRHGFIDELFVRDTFRGRGIGASAIAHVSGLCRSVGMRVILLEVDHSNLRANGLYERIGFREHGRKLLSKTIV